MNWPDGYDKPHVKWMTDEQQQAIWDFVNRGCGFLALHNSQGLYPAGGLYYKLFGGDYGDHPKPYTFTIRIEDKNHPITAGVEDFEIFDEQHTVKYYLGREHLLLRSIARDNLEAAAGWWREIGKGRFCYLAPGHTPDALGHPMVQRLIRNALRWLVRPIVAARPPVATERLSRLPDGRLLYRLKRRWRDGTTHVVFEPVELVEKLAALHDRLRTVAAFL